MPREVQQQGPMGELPEQKPIGSLSLGHENIPVHEGLGSNGDIVSIGVKVEEMRPGDRGCIYVHDNGMRFTSTAHAHGANSRFINKYILERTGEIPDPMRIGFRSVRFDVDIDGEDRRYLVDGVEGAPKLAAALQVLADLGVEKDKITVDRTKFKSRLM